METRVLYYTIQRLSTVSRVVCRTVLPAVRCAAEHWWMYNMSVAGKPWSCSTTIIVGYSVLALIAFHDMLDASLFTTLR